MNNLYIILISIFVIISSNIIYWGWSKVNFVKKDKWSYIIFCLINIVFLIYFLSMRFVDDWIRINDYFNKKIFNVNEYQHSIIISKAFLLDMCPFMSIALPLSFFDKTRKTSALLSPFCILGGLITLPFIGLSEPNATLNFHYLFVGTTNNPLYFMIHIYILNFGILALRRFNNFKYIDYLYLHIIAFSYFLYIFIVSKSLNVTYNVTGLVENDWTDPILGSYYNAGKIFNLPYPYMVIIWFFIAYIFIIGVYTSKFLIYKKKFTFLKQKIVLVWKKLFK